MSNSTSIIVATVIICMMRIFGITHDFFKDFAHIFFGGTLATWLCLKDKAVMWCTITLLVVETLCFCFGIGR